MRVRGRRLDAGFLALAALLLARLAWLTPRLLVDDLNLDYPFAFGDAWDWIANGLWFTGSPVRWSARPPLLPLALGGLAAAGWLEAWPVVAQGLWSGTLLVLYRLLRRHWEVGVALAATLVVGASQVLNLLSLEIAADLPAACLVLLALAALVAAAERTTWYPAAGGLAALAALASPLGLVVIPAAVAVVARRRRHLGDPRLWIGAALPLVAVVGWRLIRTALLDGEPTLHAPRRLVRLHFDDVDGTLWSLADLLGWPAMALAGVGAALAVRRVVQRRDPDGLRAAALVAAALPFGFFALVYDFPDRRFLAYSALPAAAWIAEGLASMSRRRSAALERSGLRRPSARLRAVAGAVVGAVAVVWAAWPSPGSPSLFLWPANLYADAGRQVTAEGGLRVEPAEARLRFHDVRDVLAASWPARVARAHAVQRAVDPVERAARRRARQRASAAARRHEGVVFLDAAVRPADRYRIQSQLGNALGHRVRFVPDDLFAGRWGWLAGAGVEPVAEVAGATLWGVDPPGLDGAWLLATQAPPAGLAQRASGPVPVRGEVPGVALPAGGSAIPEDGESARRLAAAIPGRTRLVALLLPDGPPPAIAVWLPFLLDSTELHVLRAADLPAGGLFDEPSAGASRRFGPARLVERRWRGEAVAAIDFPSRSEWNGPAADGGPPAARTPDR